MNKTLHMFLDSFVKNAQAISLSDQDKPEDTDNYRSDITNTLFVTQDDSNIDKWNPQTNQNIGKTQTNIPKIKNNPFLLKK